MSLALNHAKEIGKKEAWDFLMSHNRFLLVGHEHPDGDDVGSICALHNVLVKLGKGADMLLPDPVPHVYRLIQTSALVHTEMPEGKDYDALVFTDLGNLERGGHFNFPDVDSLCIDHHRSNERYTDYLYLQYKYAATAEMLAEMFFDAGISMDQDTCNALYMAIGTDSGFFKFSCTSAHTLLMASKLVAMGAKPDYIANRLDEKTEEAMKCYQLVAGTVHSYDDGKSSSPIWERKPWSWTAKIRITMPPFPAASKAARLRHSSSTKGKRKQGFPFALQNMPMWEIWQLNLAAAATGRLRAAPFMKVLLMQSLSL